MANEFIIRNGLKVGNLVYPNSDGSSGQVLTTNGNGTISFQNPTGGSATAPVSDQATQTSYAIQSGDLGKLLTFRNQSAGIAVSLASPATLGVSNGWYVDIHNRGLVLYGTVTVTVTGATVDGGTTLKLAPGQGLRIYTDGTNYYTMRGDSQLNTYVISVDFDGTGNLRNILSFPSDWAVTISASNQITAIHNLNSWCTLGLAFGQNPAGTGTWTSRIIAGTAFQLVQPNGDLSRVLINSVTASNTGAQAATAGSSSRLQLTFAAFI